jgi:hypothetical protein
MISLYLLSSRYSGRIVLTGLLFLHRISDNRMTGTARRNTHVFEMLCGAGGLRNVILVTTMWDSVDEQAGLLREKELRSNFWQSMSRSGSRMARFDNTYQSAWSILDYFSGFRRPLQPQIEMADQGISLTRTALSQWSEQLTTQFRYKVNGLRRRLRGVPKGSDIAGGLLLDKLSEPQDISSASTQKKLLSRKTKAEMTANTIPSYDAKQKVVDDEESTGDRTKAEDIPGSWRSFANPDKSPHDTDIAGFADTARTSFAIIELWRTQQRFVCWLLRTISTPNSSNKRIAPTTRLSKPRRP